MKKNKKKIIILFIGIIILIAFCIVYKLYKETEIKKLKTALSLEYPIIFSTDLLNEGKGTYRYYLADGKIEKIYDYRLFYPQYNDDREKILGFVWEGEYNGLVELDLTDNSIVKIISLDEINACIERVGGDTFEDEVEGDNEEDELDVYDKVDYIRTPRYYDDGYTFYFLGDIYFLHKDQETWEVETIISSKNEIYNYYVDSNDKVLVEVSSSYGEEGIDKVSEYKTRKGKKRKEKVLFDNNTMDMGDNDGIMDVSKDGKLIAYYEKKHICVYNRRTGEKKYVARPRLCDSYVLDLKFSHDNRYIFYTVGEVDFFTSGYKYTFYVVDTESKTKICLKKWKDYEEFFGFEW